MLNRISLSMLVAALFMLPPSAEAASAVAPVGQAENVEQAITAFLQSEMQERKIPGLQIAVVRHGKVVLSRNFGVASLQYGVPVTGASLFSINSATKSLTGVAVMQLVQQGKVELDAPVSRYIAGLPQAWQSVTIARLLDHTSGLPDVLNQATGKLVGPQPDDPEAAWKAVQALPMDFVTGQRFRYNQTNYVLLAQVIERQSGMLYVDFIRQGQFVPAGMRHSGFGDAKDVVPGKASSYYLAGHEYRNVIEDFPVFMRAGAGINSSADELGKWLIALQSGKLLKPESLARLWQPGTLADGKPAPWALGWPAIRRDAHRAVAGIGGARSAFYVYPNDDLAIVILTNLAGGQPEQLIDTVAVFYVPALRQQAGGAYAGYLLRQAIGRKGFDGLGPQLSAIRQQHALPNPDEGDLNAWGYRLLRQQRTSDALAVFKLAVQLYPDSANGHDSLAEAGEAAGDQALAISHYRRSVELDADNRHAIERLKQLEKNEKSPALPQIR